MAGTIIIYLVKLSTYIWLYGCIYCPEIKKLIRRKYLILLFLIFRLILGAVTPLGLLHEVICSAAGVFCIESSIKIYRRFKNGRGKD